MKHILINNNNSKYVILFFAGWGMDATPFGSFSGLDKDCMVIYDYSDFNADFDIRGYSGYYVVAWSFGVYAASLWMNTQEKKPIKAIAVNGTIYPIDDKYGIPHSIFNATLDTLSDKSLNKFIRRMCGNKSNLNFFMDNRPKRDIDSLRNELISVRNTSQLHKDVFTEWDVAYISKYDYIFPPDNQINCWKGKTRYVMLDDEYHLPGCLLSVINANIINKALVKCRFGKSFDTYDKYSDGQAKIAANLLNKWLDIDFHTEKTIYEIGCGTGLFTRMYAKTFSPSKIILNDIAPNIPIKNFEGFAKEISTLYGDGESVFPHDTPFYIVSASTVQWFENIPAFLNMLYRTLDDEGYIAISSFGESNYQEIRSVFSSSLTYYTLREWGNMLENAGFIANELSEGKFHIEFNSAKDLLRCLKNTGVNAITSPQKISKDKFKNLQELLPKRNGKYILTFNPIYIIAHKRCKKNERNNIH